MMTRDEVETIIHDNFFMGRGKTFAQSWTDAFVALGMLKLDEPKSAWEKFNAIARDWVDPLEMGEFFSDIEKAGLKIVEK